MTREALSRGLQNPEKMGKWPEGPILPPPPPKPKYDVNPRNFLHIPIMNFTITTK